ncbi:MAG: PilW family protein, partial [Methyloprofundus sp.]|nr:PilW family protein [Methyloprofundus sp.]
PGGDKANMFAPTGVNQAGTTYSIASGAGSLISLTTSQSISGIDGGVNGDSFVIRYQVNDALEMSSALSPCTRNLSLGAGENPAIQRHVISIFFYVEDNVLQCVARRDNLDDPPKSKTSSGSQPLIANVERIRVLYGQQDAAGYRAYKTAPQINTAATASAPSLGWGDVESLRLSIVLFSEQQNLASITPSAYTLNGNRSFDPTSPAENRLYRSFSVTVAFRNKGL